SGGAHYSQDLSEVDISDLDDVKVRVNDPAGDVLVHLGSSDYLSRYKIYVTHAQAWRQQFQKLDSVDLRYDNQIIVNPDLERPKAAVLTPARGKAMEAARVKPAALLARIPNDRGVPKPAFELSQKTLQPKPKAIRQSTLKAKRKKPAAKILKTIASAKKPAVRPAPRPTPPKIVAPVSGSQKQTGGQKPSPGIAKAQDESTSRE
ncbi:MAG TPA: hypothetical protein VMF10_02570, partial [Candidatus Aquilonibacter sp.]|nr:hypothetical protein [Candidatus Aquilonibacter sp.]